MWNMPTQGFGGVSPDGPTDPGPEEEAKLCQQAGARDLEVRKHIRVTRERVTAGLAFPFVQDLLLQGLPMYCQWQANPDR